MEVQYRKCGRAQLMEKTKLLNLKKEGTYL